MVTIICVLIAGIIGLIQANFNIIFKKLDSIFKDISHIKENCAFCDSKENNI